MSEHPFPMPSPPPRARRARRHALAAVAVLAVALASAFVLWSPHFGGSPQPEVRPSGPPAELALPAPDAGVPVPVVPLPGRTTAPPAEADGDGATLPPADGTAYDPLPTSDNKNLSLARRAGLHRAPNPLQLTASAALALDGNTGQVLYARNERAILPIASLTKLLGAMVVLDAQMPMSQSIRITRDDVDTLRHSRSRLRVGAVLTRDRALRLALMSSENRAAHALARTYPGGVAAFVAQMNRKAAELGMAASRFADPTGLSNANRATAVDVATLLLAASKYPTIRRYSTTKRHVAVLGGRRLEYLNANRLVRQSGWPITAQKTGYIVEAGHCVAMLARTQGRALVLVLMDAGSGTTRSQDARALRRYAEREMLKRERGAMLPR